MTKSNIAPSTLPEVENIIALLEAVTLEGVEVYELRAKGVDRGDVDNFEEGFAIKAAVNLTTEFLKTRFMLTFSAAIGEYFVDLAIHYSLERPVLVPQPISVEFTEKVGIMAAYPFLREHLFNLASRLGHPIPVLGMIRQGEFSLTPDDPPAADPA